MGHFSFKTIFPLFLNLIIIYSVSMFTYEWKINYTSSSSEENDENSNGVFFARMIITVDEIKRYNDKKKILKKVLQKDPIVMDIYI